MNLKEILDETETIGIYGNTDVKIEGLSLDSRKTGQGFLFAAISGANTDGHRFIENAVKKGASAVICENLPTHMEKGVTYVQVTDTSLAVARIASSYYGNPSRDIYLAGVTGTNGKTTLTYLLEAMWKNQNRNTGIIGTIENRYAGIKDSSVMTTPDAVELSALLNSMRSSGVENVSMEVSSHSLDRKRVYGCHFNCGIFTNITQDHLDYHGSFENYFEAKKKFFTEVLNFSEKNPKTAVINIDDRYGRDIASVTDTDVLSYSVGDRAADIFATDINFKDDGITARVHTPWGDLDLSSELIGKHNLYNLLAALAVSVNQTHDTEVTQRSLSGKIIIPGRLEKIDNNSGLNVFVDYAHTPDALENVLNTVRPITRGRIITVFGCGGDRDRGKRPLMGRIVYEMSDISIITSDNPRTEPPSGIIDDIVEGIEPATGKQYSVIGDREKAIKRAIDIARRDDFVLIAGKGHEDYQIIGSKKLHFDDREVARKYIIDKEKQNV